MHKTRIMRTTKETAVSISLFLNGKGTSSINTSLPFFDHMLTLFTKNCACNLHISAQGDIEIDEHHLMEDVGISLGEAMKKAIGSKQGITRYGFASVPMDDSLVEVSLDISGRPFLVYNMGNAFIKEKERYELYEHFFYSLAIHAGITLHINLRYGSNFHHNIEAAFKAFGRAVRMAATKDPRMKGVPSTKGML